MSTQSLDKKIHEVITKSIPQWFQAQKDRFFKKTLPPVVIKPTTPVTSSQSLGLSGSFIKYGTENIRWKPTHRMCDRSRADQGFSGWYGGPIIHGPTGLTGALGVSGVMGTLPTISIIPTVPSIKPMVTSVPYTSVVIPPLSPELIKAFKESMDDYIQNNS